MTFAESMPSVLVVDDEPKETLLHDAEAALKKAKRSPDPYLFFTQEMTDKDAMKLSLGNELRRALQNEEFVLYNQPKVELATGRICGFEALIQWNHPKRGGWCRQGSLFL